MSRNSVPAAIDTCNVEFEINHFIHGHKIVEIFAGHLDILTAVKITYLQRMFMLPSASVADVSLAG